MTINLITFWDIRKNMPRLSMIYVLRISKKYLPIKAPRTKGVIFCTTMLFVGLFPSNILCGNSKSICWELSPDFCNSAWASSLLLPFINASVCARKLASKIVWCKGICKQKYLITNKFSSQSNTSKIIDTWFWDCTGIIKSAGTNFVPWCNSW